MQPNATDAAVANGTDTYEPHVEQAKRAFALKKYEQAVEHYADALEIMTGKLGEDAPEIADLYFEYGKALLENAISQSSVLGHGQAESAPQEEEAPKGPLISFSGDADDDMDDRAVDLFSEASKAVAEAEAVEDNEEDDEEEDAEPEDDFNAAWEILDLARTIYEKQTEADPDDALKLKLADTYVALGDVSLETEKFDQAVSDYETSLGLKMKLLPGSSRQIAEAHYKLSIVLDMTPGRLSDSIIHAENALKSIEQRLSELNEALPSSTTTIPEDIPDPKGKGKAKHIPGDDSIARMTTSQIEGEIKEMGELKSDLDLKIDELKTAPNESVATSAPAQVAAALDAELNGGSGVVQNQQPVINDLTGIVKKKKKVTEETSSAKRKAEDDGEGSGSEKKAKVADS